MGLYEHTFLVRQDATQAQVDALLEQYTGVLTAGGAKVERVENWGIKSLTFRMKKNRKAFFVFLTFLAPMLRLQKWNAKCQSTKMLFVV